MKPDSRWRLTQLLVAALVVIAGLVWAERAAWRQISNLRLQLQEAQTERFQAVDRLRSAVLHVHMESRDAGGERVAAAIYDTKLVSIRTMMYAMEREAPAAASNVLASLNLELDRYLEALERGAGAEAALERVLIAIENVAEANRKGASDFLVDAESSLKRLQQFLFVSILGLVASGTAIMALFYRRTIAPLRSNLSESLAVIERHEKLASLGVLAAGIAHEIRNPLTAIKVRLFTLKSSHSPGSSEYEDLEVIRSEIDRLERIVSEFLQFARPAEPELQEVSTEKLLREVQQLLEAELRRRSVDIRLDAVQGGNVLADTDKMKQVLINLIQNGAESIEGQGVVTLGGRVESRLLNGRTTRAVIIDISDTGGGIAPETQKRLFDPFFTTKEEGTGLGLAIAARIVEKHGGVIEYETELSRGTRFSIILPLAERHEIESQSFDH